MRSVFRIYADDWKNIFKVPTGIALILAISLLPCVYDWVNIESVWDPYANTTGVKVAIVNEDRGATVLGHSLNIGEEMVGNLRDNPKLGWTFVDREEAKRGVNRGAYYASLLVPPDFSERMTGIAEGKLDRPEVVYTVNEKVSAIAPKITSSGVSAIAEQINESFVEAVSQALLTKLKEIGVQVEEQLPTIRKVENGVFRLEESLPDIRAAGSKVLEVEKKLPEIRAKAEVIPEIEKKLPEIDRAAGYLLKIRQNWPKIEAAAGEIESIQAKMPLIREAADRVAELDRRFGETAEAIAAALDRADRALKDVAAARESLPRAVAAAERGSGLAEELAGFQAANAGAFEAISPLLRTNLELAGQASDVAGLLAERAAGGGEAPSPSELNAASVRLAGAAEATRRAASLLDRIGGYSSDGKALADASRRARTAADRLGRQADALKRLASASSDEAAASLSALAKMTGDGIRALQSRYDGELAPAISKGLANLEAEAGKSAAELKEAGAKLPDIGAVLEDAEAGLSFGHGELARMRDELPAMRERISGLTKAFLAKADEFEKAIGAAAPFVRNELPLVGKKLDEAADFAKNGLPQAERELAKLSAFVRDRLPEAEAGVHRLADLIRNDLPQLESAVKGAAAKLREVEGDSRFAEMAKLLKGDIEAESEFLASPVRIKEQREYPIPNYGSAMSPFYGVLSLWVGSTLLISLLKPDPDYPEGLFKPYQLYLGRLATFATIGLVQTLFVTLGDLWILGAYVANGPAFVLFSMLVSLTFVSITYALLSVFGNVGKGLAILFMVFQFSSSGGTFPISTTSPFFQAINPFMPFTYAIALLREAVGGVLWEEAGRDIAFLIGFVALSLLLALLLKRPLSGIIRKSAENAKKTKIIA